MRNAYAKLRHKPKPELFFQAWVTFAVALAIYIATAATLVTNINDMLWYVGAPIAFAKAVLVVSGLGFLVWFVAVRRPESGSN
ncbi:MAG: hypothetical protein V2I25_12550 [Woeseiaceae bacterium]|jgi:hypothetical protein|nr:hypothetical protein [Woeseiaceae bacterium]